MEASESHPLPSIECMIASKTGNMSTMVADGAAHVTVLDSQVLKYLPTWQSQVRAGMHFSPAPNTKVRRFRSIHVPNTPRSFQSPPSHDRVLVLFDISFKAALLIKKTPVDDPEDCAKYLGTGMTSQPPSIHRAIPSLR